MRDTNQSANETLAALKRAPVAVFRVGGGSRPDVMLVATQDGQQRILKDFGACDPWFAKGIGRLLAWRESRALVRLRGVDGVPLLIDRIGSRALLLEYAPAMPIMKRHKLSLANNEAPPDWNRFLTRFEDLINAMHDHGVTHGDLRSPHNVLIGDNGEPWVVDFVSASFQARPWTLLFTWPLELMHRKLRQVDLSAVDKYRVRLCLEDDTEIDAGQRLKTHPDANQRDANINARYQHESSSDRAWRALGVTIRNLARRLLTRRR